MVEERTNQDSVAQDPHGDRESRHTPALPSGYLAQPVGGFRDPTGRFTYEFNRVYGRLEQSDERGPVLRLDEDLSYWGLFWSMHANSADARVAGRWLTYAEARRLPDSRLTFERFSSPLLMRDELEKLMPVEEVGPTPRPAAPARGPVAFGLPSAAERG